jgi:Ca2+-transporting ATPase
LERALAVADRANNASVQERNGHWTVTGDPTEGALIVAARKAGLESERLNQRFTRVGEVPFSAERKLMSTVHTDAETEGRVLVFTKGAPDVLLTRVRTSLWARKASAVERRFGEILAANDALADARCASGVAFRASIDGSLTANGIDETIERDLVFAGLIGMIDPPRDEARDAVARARQAGIRPVMITGDHPRTAAVIAQELGIVSDARVLTGSDLERMSDESLDEAAGAVSVYARVNPEHATYRAPAAWAIVAMTGDGVNDAPAPSWPTSVWRWSHRNRCLQTSGRHGARRRQLRDDRRGGGGRSLDLFEYPEVPALPVIVERRRSDDDVLWCRVRRRNWVQFAGRYRRAPTRRGAAPLDQSRH